MEEIGEFFGDVDEMGEEEVAFGGGGCFPGFEAMGFDVGVESEEAGVGRGVLIEGEDGLGLGEDAVVFFGMGVCGVSHEGVDAETVGGGGGEEGAEFGGVGEGDFAGGVGLGIGNEMGLPKEVDDLAAFTEVE